MAAASNCLMAFCACRHWELGAAASVGAAGVIMRLATIAVADSIRTMGNLFTGVADWCLLLIAADNLDVIGVGDVEHLDFIKRLIEEVR